MKKGKVEPKQSKESKKEQENVKERMEFALAGINKVCSQAGLEPRCILQHDQYAIKSVFKFQPVKEGTLAECQASYLDDKMKEAQAKEEGEKEIIEENSVVKEKSDK